MAIGFKHLTLADRLELADYELTPRFDTDRIRFPLSPYIAGIEVTQSIQYYNASRHLTDAADRGPDNSLKLAAFKPAWVRVYVRSGFLGGAVLTGKIGLDRQISVLPVLWADDGDFLPRSPGSVSATPSADYGTERGSLAATLNFVVPADRVHGRLRIRVIIWPQGGSENSPSDIEEFFLDATLQQTLRVRGIFVSYNGPNASGTVPNMNLAAPTVTDLQTTCGNTFTVYPVQSTGVFSSGGSIPWNTPLTGMATNPGGCSQQWLDLNVAVAQARANDGNRTDVLYVGLIPAAVPIANVGGCNSSGVSAVPNGQQWTMAHELGHAAGLQHGPCGTPGDPNYPAYEPYDPANAPTSSLGEYGLDINDGTIHPPSEKDFMSYCGPVWISLYHYNRLYDNAALDPRRVSVPRIPQVPELVDPWLWPWEYIPDPPSWELPSHFAKVTVQPLIVLTGTVNLAGELNVASVMRVRAVPRAPESVPTSMVAELVGATGDVVSRAVVRQMPAHGYGCGCGGGSHDHGGHSTPQTGYAFQAMLADVEPGSALRIVRIDPNTHGKSHEVWCSRPAGDPPHVDDIEVCVEKSDGHIAWKTRCKPDRAVSYSIQFSKDEGVSWNGLAVGLTENSHRFSLADLPSGTLIFRVIGHDGFYSSHAESKPIRFKPRAPAVSIVHPYDGRTYQTGTPLRLFAVVSTHVGARNPKLKLKWHIDGKAVGEGAECWIDAPKAGKHTCRVTARDDGGESEMTVTFLTEGELWQCAAD